MLNKNILINECLNIIRIYKLHIVESDPLLSFRFVFCFCFVLLFCFVFLLVFFFCLLIFLHKTSSTIRLWVVCGSTSVFNIHSYKCCHNVHFKKWKHLRLFHWLQISFIYIVNALALIRLVLVANDDLLTNNVIWLYSM